MEREMERRARIVRIILSVVGSGVGHGNSTLRIFSVSGGWIVDEQEYLGSYLGWRLIAVMLLTGYNAEASRPKTHNKRRTSKDGLEHLGSRELRRVRSERPQWCDSFDTRCWRPRGAGTEI